VHQKEGGAKGNIILRGLEQYNSSGMYEVEVSSKKKMKGRE